jgi:CRP-like cAMP-binding protein
MRDGALGRLYRDGESIVLEGEVGDCMFAIQTGRVEVVHTEPGGGEVVLATMEVGKTFGEMAVFQKEKRSATVRAKGEARVLTIDKRTFLARVQEDPTLAFQTVRNLCERLRQSSDELLELRARLARLEGAGQADKAAETGQ